MNPRVYTGYVIGIIVLGCCIFFYEMHVNNQPLLNVTSNSSFSTTISSYNSNTSDVQPLSLIIASTSAEQGLGLGGRSSLPAGEGMLFIFSAPGNYGFWMKDMRFPIDMIWMDSNFIVTHIEQNVSPDTYPQSMYPGVDSLYVLEVNAGYAQKNNLSAGETLDFVRKFVENEQ